ncbi:MAG: Calx-beta domain-containing protein [Planctomycetota bacterium]
MSYAKKSRRPHRRQSLEKPRRAVGLAVEPLEERKVLAAAAPMAQVQWSSYIGSSGSDDAVKSAWVVPATQQNGYGLNGDLAILNINGELRGVFQNTLSNSAFVDRFVSTGNAQTIAQVQASVDGTRLYVAGTTRTAGWARINGFDPTVGTGKIYSGDSAYLGQGTVVTTEDGFFVSLDMVLRDALGNERYATYVGGDGENVVKENPFNDRGFWNDGYWLNGRDYVNTFYVDPTKPNAEAYVAGQGRARKGIVADAPNETVRSATFVDDTRDYGQFAQIDDGILYSLNDRPQSSAATGQFNWATYLSPTTPEAISPDGDPVSAYVWTGRVQEVDFVWSANSKADGSGDKLIFMLAKVRQGTAVDAPLATMLVTMNQTQLRDTAAMTPDPGTGSGTGKPVTYWGDRLDRLKRWVSFEPFRYDTGFVEKVVSNSAVRSDQTGTGPALFLRYADAIRKIDLPRNGDIQFDAQKPAVERIVPGTWGGWNREFQGEISADAMSISPNGEKLYVASTVKEYRWDGYPSPMVGTSQGGNFTGGKVRSGDSDAVLLEMNVESPQINWMMLQGGDGAERGTGVSAFSDGTVWLMGTTDSKPSASNPNGWIPTEGKPLDNRLDRAPQPAQNALGASSTYTGGEQDGFIVAIKTSSAIVSKAEIDVGGVVNDVYKPIPDKSTAASAAIGTDFGRSGQGGAGAERTFRIRNTGTDPLLLGAPQLPVWLKLKPGTTPAATVAPGASTELVLVVDPASKGTFRSNVTIPNNDADEGSYTFAVTATVTDPPPTTFSATTATSSIAEGNSGTKTVRFTVTLAAGTPAPTFPATVDYEVVGITATAGSDFVAQNGRLTFAAAGSQSVDVTINGDTTFEVNETFQLRLKTPSQGVVSAEAGQATVTILNDETLSIGFATTAVELDEGAVGARPAVPLTLVLSQPAPFDVTVRYATSAGSAISGSDFIAATGTARIPAGQTTAVVPGVFFIGDNVSEANETFAVQVSNPTGGATIDASAARAVITIRNDDGPVPLPTIRASSPSAIEGGVLTFSITLARAMSSAVVLNLTYVAVTAPAGDFIAGPATVTIPAGRTTASVTVRTVNNTVVDGDRRLQLEVRSGSTLVATGIGTIRDNDRPARSLSSGQQLALAAAFESLATDSSTKKK